MANVWWYSQGLLDIIKALLRFWCLLIQVITWMLLNSFHNLFHIVSCCTLFFIRLCVLQAGNQTLVTTSHRGRQSTPIQSQPGSRATSKKAAKSHMCNHAVLLSHNLTEASLCIYSGMLKCMRNKKEIDCHRSGLFNGREHLLIYKQCSLTLG